MFTTTRRAKTPLAIGTLAGAVVLAMAAFNAAAAADTQPSYERSQVKPSSGAVGTYKSSRKTPDNAVHKRAQKGSRYSKAPKSAKREAGNKKRASKLSARNHRGGPKQVKAPFYKHKGGKTYAYKEPIRKYRDGRKDGYRPVYKYRSGTPRAHGRFYIGAPIVRYGWSPYTPTEYYYSRYGCHPVSKLGYTRNGRKVKFGGTMCYDDYGYGYIVNGSRHIIHYY